MEDLPRLKARISSLHEFRGLVRALRAMAASHVQEAQSALAGVRRYVEAIEDAIAEGAGLLQDTDGRPAPPESLGPDVLIVICSEHGFAGTFNEQLLDRVATEGLPGQQLAIIGRRGALLAEERRLEPSWSLPMVTHISGVAGIARQIAENVAGASAAGIVFGSYRKGGHFSVETRTILPLDPALLARSRRRAAPLYHLAPEVLLERLADEYLFAEITRAVTKSMASENAARLRVMEAADHNIGDKLDLLRHQEQSLRQAAITEELLDVVIGAEAVLT